MIFRIVGHTCLVILCSAILVVGFVLAYFIADRALPVTAETELLTPIVKAGGKVELRQKLTYLRECGAHVDRALYGRGKDGPTRQYLVDIDYERPMRGLGEFTVTFEETVPENFLPGEAIYRATPSYRCNPLQTIYWPITRPDTIVKFRVEAP